MSAENIEGNSHESILESIGDALEDKQQNNRLLALKDELESVTEMGTYTVQDRPENRGEVVQNKWVSATKKDDRGKIIRYRARLVAKGFTQIQDVDYFQVFAPVLRFDSVRFLLSHVATNDCELTQFDVKTAFLNGELEEEIFMEIPKIPVKFKHFMITYLRKNPDLINKENFEQLLQGENRKVLKLNKALYGLKQASIEWFKRFTKLSLDAGLIECDSDPCLFRNSEVSL